MRAFIASVFLLSIIAAQGIVQFTYSQTTPPGQTNLVGRWRVKFKLVDSSEKNLIFDSQAKGSGSFLLLDTGPDNQPVFGPQPATWSQTKNNVSISSEVELPIGTCCRETGTLIFKGKFSSANSISGKLIFVTNIDEDESPFKFHSTIGTFSAKRLPDN